MFDVGCWMFNSTPIAARRRESQNCLCRSFQFLPPASKRNAWTFTFGQLEIAAAFSITVSTPPRSSACAANLQIAAPAARLFGRCRNNRPAPEPVRRLQIRPAGTTLLGRFVREPDAGQAIQFRREILNREIPVGENFRARFDFISSAFVEINLNAAAGHGWMPDPSIAGG